MSQATKGAQNQTDIFCVKTDFSGCVTVDADMLPTITAATALSNKALRLNQKFGTNLQKQTTGVYNVDFDSDQYTEDLGKFLENFGAEVATDAYENQSPAAVVSGTRIVNPILCIHYGPTLPSEGKVEVVCTLNYVDATSNSVNWTGGAKNKKVQKLVGTKPTADFTIKKEFFDDTIVDIPVADVVITKASSLGFVTLYLDPAS